MDISVIIPIRLINNQVAELTTDCVKSLRGYDELILQFDMEGEGFAKTVNKGVKKSTGDWIAIVNNDTKMLNGSIREMCKTDCLVRPKLVEGTLAKFAFVVMSRRLWEDVGGLSEAYGIGFWEDNEFLDKVVAKGYRLEDSEFSVWHFGGGTISHFNPGKLMTDNEKIYEQRKLL